MKMEPNWIEKLKGLGACDEALEWAKGYSSLKVAWAACKRGDYMFWLWGRTCGKDRKALVLVLCKCVRLVLKYVPKSESRPLTAIQTIEKWVRGEATMEEVQNAADAAYTAYVSVNTTYAAYAAFIAADATYVAADAAAYLACLAAHYAAYTAYADAPGTTDTAAYAAYYASNAASTAAYMAKARKIPKVHKAYTTASAYTTADGAKAKVLKQCAEIVRKAMPEPPDLNQCA